MKKLLALNRSEIAIRIMRAATELGLRTVAIFSKEDRLSLHRFKADEAYEVGEGKGPVVPGTERPVTTPEAVRRVAGVIGFPLIIKAAFGGGGRGMRVVEKPGDFAGRLDEARREAGAAFGNDAVFLERYVRRARHVE